MVSIFALEIIVIVAYCTDLVSHANSDNLMLQAAGILADVFNHDIRPGGTASAEEVAIQKQDVVSCSGGKPSIWRCCNHVSERKSTFNWNVPTLKRAGASRPRERTREKDHYHEGGLRDGSAHHLCGERAAGFKVCQHDTQWNVRTHPRPKNVIHGTLCLLMSPMLLHCALFLAAGHPALRSGLVEKIECLDAASAGRTCIIVRHTMIVQAIPLWSVSQLVLLGKKAIRDLE